MILFEKEIYLVTFGNQGHEVCITLRTHLSLYKVSLIQPLGSPRPSPQVSIKTNVSSVLHGTATLQCTIQAYPVPSPDNFTWMKCEHQDCEKIHPSSKKIIITNNLLTKLLIQDMSNSDYGVYKLAVSNGIGNDLEQVFYITQNGRNAKNIIY